MFSTYKGFIGDHFFLLSTDSTYSRIPGDKGGQIFFRLFFGTRFTYKMLYYNLYHVSNFYAFVTIGHVIQIVIHQFVCKMSAKKILKSEKNWSPFIPRYAGIRRISTEEKKIDPL